MHRTFDSVLTEIADYTSAKHDFNSEAIETARWCLLDSLGCGLLALEYPACTKLLGPVVPGAILTGGARVPGTDWQLEPVKAAFNIGCMFRWLDFNDTWLAAEWGHPSDNFGAILALTDYLDRNPNNPWQPNRQWTVRDVLDAAIQAYEIQGVLALKMDSIGLVWITSCLFALRQRPSHARSSVALHRKLPMRLAWLGWTVERSARIDMLRTRALAKAGLRETRLNERFSWRCGRWRAKRDTPPH